jgi:hypothetical protein
LAAAAAQVVALSMQSVAALLILVMSLAELLSSSRNRYWPPLRCC